MVGAMPFSVSWQIFSHRFSTELRMCRLLRCPTFRDRQESPGGSVLGYYAVRCWDSFPRDYNVQCVWQHRCKLSPITRFSYVIGRQDMLWIMFGNATSMLQQADKTMSVSFATFKQTGLLYCTRQSILGHPVQGLQLEVLYKCIPVAWG